MNTRFFQQPTSSRSEIPLGASPRQDGIFRALAFTVVDKLVSRNFNDAAVADLLLDKLTHYFPNNVPKAAHANSIDTLELMTNTPQKASRTALELTWVLRQLMVDAMCQAPVQSLSAFVENGDVIKPTEMRQPGTSIDSTSLETLAQLLKTKIVIHQTEKNKQLPARYVYGQGTEKVIHINEKDGRFSPKVIKNMDALRPLNSVTYDNPNLLVDSTQDDIIVNRVETLMHRLDQANLENTNWLNNMLEDDNLTLEDLQQHYIAHADVMTWQKQFIEPATDRKNLLVNVVAAMVSFGITSREDLFATEAAVEKTVSSPSMV